jgi:hypothetical protein
MGVRVASTFSSETLRRPAFPGRLQAPDERLDQGPGGAGARVGRRLLAVGRPVGQLNPEALVGDHRRTRLEADPSSDCRNRPAWGPRAASARAASSRRVRGRAVLGLAEQGDPGRGPAGEAPVGVGVGVADH